MLGKTAAEQPVPAAGGQGRTEGSRFSRTNWRCSEGDTETTEQNARRRDRNRCGRQRRRKPFLPVDWRAAAERAHRSRTGDEIRAGAVRPRLDNTAKDGENHLGTTRESAR